MSNEDKDNHDKKNKDKKVLKPNNDEVDHEGNSSNIEKNISTIDTVILQKEILKKGDTECEESKFIAKINNVLDDKILNERQPKVVSSAANHSITNRISHTVSFSSHDNNRFQESMKWSSRSWPRHERHPLYIHFRNFQRHNDLKRILGNIIFPERSFTNKPESSIAPKCSDQNGMFKKIIGIKQLKETFSHFGLGMQNSSTSSNLEVEINRDPETEIVSETSSSETQEQPQVATSCTQSEELDEQNRRSRIYNVYSACTRPFRLNRHPNDLATPETVLESGRITITPLPFPPQVLSSPPPIQGAPPSYSAVMRLGPIEDIPRPGRRHEIGIQPSPPFIAPIPPPSYAQAQGYYVAGPLVASVDQLVFGPDPLSVVCPRCATVVITSTQAHRSNLTHFSALAMCLCGCWPCCLLPYCMDSCKNTYHHCPTCQQFLGMYRPW